MYFFGVRESDCYGVVNVTNGHATLFVPRLQADYATWMGRLWTCPDFKTRYNVDDVKYVDEVSNFYLIIFVWFILPSIYSTLRYKFLAIVLNNRTILL